MIETSRRSLLTGLGAIIAAPAIVRSSSLMPVKLIPGWSQARTWKKITAYSFMDDNGACFTLTDRQVICSPGFLERADIRRTKDGLYIDELCIYRKEDTPA